MLLRLASADASGDVAGTCQEGSALLQHVRSTPHQPSSEILVYIVHIARRYLRYLGQGFIGKRQKDAREYLDGWRRTSVCLLGVRLAESSKRKAVRRATAVDCPNVEK
eukprot:3310615-Amphidinium_carterae.1